MALNETLWAWQLAGISPQCKLVAIYIGNSANPECTIEIASLCDFACLDEGAARTAIEELAISTGMSWDEVSPGMIECYLPLPKSRDPRPRKADVSPMVIYVMSCGDRTKIGISRDEIARRRQLQDFNANPVVIQWAFVGPTHLIRRAERAAHGGLASSRIHGEWYSISTPKAIEIVKLRLREIGLSPA